MDLERIRKHLESLECRSLFPDQQDPPTEQRIAELEAAIGCRLPEDYRAVLAEWGSIGVSDSVFPVPGMDDENFAIGSFFGFFESPSSPGLLQLDLLHVFKATQDRIGSNMLAIGSSDSGMVCLALATGDQPGTVWAWPDEPYDEEEGGRMLYWLAESIDHLLLGLQPFIDSF